MAVIPPTIRVLDLMRGRVPDISRPSGADSETKMTFDDFKTVGLGVAAVSAGCIFLLLAVAIVGELADFLTRALQ